MSRENLARGLSKREVEGLRQEAWIGDAVLELYVREYILKQDASRDDARRISLVRNSFLNRIGQPTRVEAEIGRRYHEGGLEAAYAWIREQLEPLITEAQKAQLRASSPRKKARR
jgi:dsRNA-specific ribonuclease